MPIKKKPISSSLSIDVNPDVGARFEARPGPVRASPGHLPQRTCNQVRVITDSLDIMSLRGFSPWCWDNPHPHKEERS